MRFITITLMAASFFTTFAARGLSAQDATGAKKSAATKGKATASKQTKSTKAVASKPAAKQVASKSDTTPAAHRKTLNSAKSAKKPVVASRHYVQQQPTTQRYKEIQQALFERGYFRGDPDGTWGPESIDSLKRFQRDQSLTEDGKIGSLSLIALGLGPKRAVTPESASAQN